METEILEVYKNLIDELREVLLNSSLKPSLVNNIDHVIVNLERLGSVPKLSDSVKRHMDICNQLTHTYSKKNHDYGDSFGESLDEFGLVASIVRIGDKFNRLKSLLNKQAQVKDEAIEDTLLDMANYCIMTYMWLHKNEE